MINGEVIRLEAGGYQADITTSGATLARLTRNGHDLVVPFDPDTQLPCAWQGKTLAPWPNRVHGSAFDWHGEHYEVPCNELEAGTALHGMVGWSDFTVAQRGKDGSSVTLELTLPASYSYPWSLEIVVDYRLDALTGLSVQITTTNVAAATPAYHTPGAAQVDGGPAPAPFGVGAHPYLTRAAGVDASSLQVPAQRYLTMSETLLPTGMSDVEGTDFDWRESRVIAGASVDHAFTDLPEHWQVALSAPGEGSVVLSSDAPWVQIYTGEYMDRRGVAVEPMTCPPNALVSGDSLISLALGESYTLRYNLRELDA